MPTPITVSRAMATAQGLRKSSGLAGGVLSVVVPPELHQKLAAMAEAEGCSLEQVAIAILERGFFGVSPPC